MFTVHGSGSISVSIWTYGFLFSSLPNLLYIFDSVLTEINE